MLDSRQEAVLQLTHLLRKRVAIRQWLEKPLPTPFACACLGKIKSTDPVCACAMAYVEDAAGIYYELDIERSPDGLKVVAERVPAGKRVDIRNLDARGYIPHYGTV